MNRVSSEANLTLAFFIIQYFLIKKGMSVTSDIKKNKLSCFFNNFGLMHETDYTFLFLRFSCCCFFPQSNLGVGGGGGDALH